MDFTYVVLFYWFMGLLELVCLGCLVNLFGWVVLDVTVGWFGCSGQLVYGWFDYQGTLSVELKIH